MVMFEQLQLVESGNEVVDLVLANNEHGLAPCLHHVHLVEKLGCGVHISSTASRIDNWL